MESHERCAYNFKMGHVSMSLCFFLTALSLMLWALGRQRNEQAGFLNNGVLSSSK